MKESLHLDPSSIKRPLDAKAKCFDVLHALDTMGWVCKSPEHAMHVCDVKAHSIKCCFHIVGS